MVALLTWWVLFIGAVAFIHHYIIVIEHDRPNYGVWTVLKGIAAIVHGVFFRVEDMNDYSAIFIFQVFTWFVIFNPLLNKLRKINFWYTGRDSGWIDKFLNTRPMTHKILYAVSIVVVMYCVYLISQRTSYGYY